MNHGLMAIVMVVSGLLFTSCTATVVQHWALTRQARPAASAEHVPASIYPGEKRQALVPASTGSAEECRPEDNQGKPTAFPRFTPVRQTTPGQNPPKF